MIGQSSLQAGLCPCDTPPIYSDLGSCLAPRLRAPAIASRLRDEAVHLNISFDDCIFISH